MIVTVDEVKTHLRIQHDAPAVRHPGDLVDVRAHLRDLGRKPCHLVPKVDQLALGHSLFLDTGSQQRFTRIHGKIQPLRTTRETGPQSPSRSMLDETDLLDLLDRLL